MGRHAPVCISRMGKLAGHRSCRAYGRLTRAQKLRLQELKRPGRPRRPIGSPTPTDRALANKGLVRLERIHSRPGYVVAQITLLGRDAVPSDGYEYCACGSVTPESEAACLSCGLTKDWANRSEVPEHLHV